MTIHWPPSAGSMSVSAGYGLAAFSLRTLGLFNVLYSPLLHLLLALIGLILLVQLGDQLSIAWQLRQLSKRIEQPRGESGSPLRSLCRSRSFGCARPIHWNPPPSRPCYTTG